MSDPVKDKWMTDAFGIDWTVRSSFGVDRTAAQPAHADESGTNYARMPSVDGATRGVESVTNAAPSQASGEPYVSFGDMISGDAGSARDEEVDLPMAAANRTATEGAPSQAAGEPYEMLGDLIAEHAGAAVNEEVAPLPVGSPAGSVAADKRKVTPEKIKQLNAVRASQIERLREGNRESNREINPDGNPDEGLEDLLAEKLPGRFPKVQTNPKSATGLKPKPVGAEYAGEHNELGAWRAGNPDLADFTRITTALSSDEERAANTLKQDSRGRFKKGSGEKLPANKGVGYAQSPETGDIVTFTEGKVTAVTTGRHGKTTSKQINSSQIAQAVKNEKTRVELTHHSSALGGDAVLDEQGQPKLDSEGRPIMRSREAASAGIMRFDKSGRITNISNVSGHYKPEIDYLMQAVEHLMKQGAFFEDKITDAQGSRLKSTSDNAKLYKAVQEKLKTVPELSKQVGNLQNKMKYVQDSEELTSIEDEINSIKAQLNAIADAMSILRALGIGPTQRIRQDATASFLNIDAKTAGRQVHLDGGDKNKLKTMEVGEFLKTGGGDMEQAAAKSEMLAEIAAPRVQTRQEAANKAEALYGVELQQEEKLKRNMNLDDPDIEDGERKEIDKNRKIRAETAQREKEKRAREGIAEPEVAVRRPDGGDYEAEPRPLPTKEEIASALAALRPAKKAGAARGNAAGAKAAAPGNSDSVPLEGLESYATVEGAPEKTKPVSRKKGRANRRPAAVGVESYSIPISNASKS